VALRALVWARGPVGVVRGMTEALGDPSDKLTTDPPRPPGTPDVDDLVGDSLPAGEERSEPEDEDVTDDPVSVEPPD
jgi:hypothetical protein